MKRYHHLIFVILLFLHINAQAQYWQKTYPGTDQVEGTVLEDSDGGFLATRGNGAAVFKTDAGGALLWTWKPAGLGNVTGYDICTSPDGNYFATGFELFNGQIRYFLSKISPAGAELWTNILNLGQNAQGRSLLRKAAGGGIFLSLEYDHLLKLDDNGNILWHKNGVVYSTGDLVATADGGAYFLVNPNVTGIPQMLVRKIDASGNIQQTFSYDGGVGGLEGRGMCGTADGGFALTGTTKMAPYDYFLLKAGGNGIQQWFSRFGETAQNDIGLSIKQTQSGSYLITGWTSVAFDRNIRVYGLSSLGQVVFSGDYGWGEGIDVQPLVSGDILLLARNFTAGGLQLIRTGTQAPFYANKIEGRILNDQNADCNLQPGETGLSGWAVKARGTITKTALTDASGNFSIDVDTGKYTVTMTPPTYTWQPCGVPAPLNFSGAPQTRQLGDWLMKPATQSTGNISGVVFLDLDGDCTQDPDEPLMPNYPVAASTEGGEYKKIAYSDASGHYSIDMPAGNDVFVWLPESPQNPYCTPCCIDYCFAGFLEFAPIIRNLGVHCSIPNPVVLQGSVFFDANSNCSYDAGEQTLPSGWTIRAVEAGTTDTFKIEAPLLSNGFYAVAVDTGNYILTITPPNYLYLPCLPVQTIHIGPGGATQDFALMPLALCPSMRVDIGTSALRICRENRYYVHYCNDGTDAAANASVRISLPPELTLTDSDIPGVQQPGNVWLFDLGNLPQGLCGDFSFEAFLDCNSLPGASHCVEAHIFPDSICGPQSASWDGASVQLEADCIGDSLVLRISNMGWGDMSQPLEFIVVEDNVLIKSATFQLGSGQSSFVTVYPNGATIIAQAQQSPYHPGKSMPVVAVEGCGGAPVSLGFVTQYSQDDADHFVAVDCREGVNSYDPNRKSAQPTGVTNAHYIQSGAELNYQIDFQNLGNGTAFDVVLLDTLSNFLDTAGLEPGASAHPYQMSILDGHILRFEFANINLPPAAVDETNSIGFVRFRVHQKAGNQPGTLIENRAGIYFDQNPVVMTNTVTHRIPGPQLSQYQEVNNCYNSPFLGHPVVADTVIVQTQHYAFFDSSITWAVHVYPPTILSVDTTAAPGDVIFGVQIWADTLFAQAFTDENGCPAQVYVQVRVLSGAQEPGLFRSIAVAPNPASGSFRLRLQLRESVAGTGRMVDVYGRTVATLFEYDIIGAETEHQVNCEGLAPGMYWLELRIGGEQRVLRVVLQ